MFCVLQNQNQNHIQYLVLNVILTSQRLSSPVFAFKAYSFVITLSSIMSVLYI
jgi:hypothetical protein